MLFRYRDGGLLELIPDELRDGVTMSKDRNELGESAWRALNVIENAVRKHFHRREYRWLFTNIDYVKWSWLSFDNPDRSRLLDRWPISGVLRRRFIWSKYHDGSKRPGDVKINAIYKCAYYSGCRNEEQVEFDCPRDLNYPDGEQEHVRFRNVAKGYDGLKLEKF